MPAKRKASKKVCSDVEDPGTSAGDDDSRGTGAAEHSSAPNRTSSGLSTRQSSRLKTRTANRQPESDENSAAVTDSEVSQASSLLTGATSWDRETSAPPTQGNVVASDRIRGTGFDGGGNSNQPSEPTRTLSKRY